VGFDPLEVLLPAQMLTVDIAHVGDEKSVLLTWLAGVLVDVFNSALQSISNQLPRKTSAGWSSLLDLIISDQVITGFERQSCIRLFSGRDCGRCHNHQFEWLRFGNVGVVLGGPKDVMEA